MEWYVELAENEFDCGFVAGSDFGKFYLMLLNWNALRLLNGFELVLVLLFLVRANQLCQTTLNDFDLLRP